MTIYYIDPEGGNDANNGLSFANRWRTFKNTNSITVTTSDEFRVMASKPKQNSGAAAWVDNQDWITYSVPKFAILADGNTLMTPTTNVTITGDFNASPVVSTQCNLIRCTTSGKSGKIAHLALGSTMDLSAYTHLSLALRSDSDTYPNVLDNITLNLCSDTTGDVVVLALPLEATYRSSALTMLLTNGGAALPSGINSISLTLTVATPGTNRAIFFVGLIACQGPDHADHISHGCLVSKQTAGAPEWMAVRAFRLTNRMYVGGRASTTGERVWRGTSETVNTWQRLPTRVRFTAASEPVFFEIKDGVKVTGGWNRTDMSTQDDVTWASGEYRSISGTANSNGFLNVQAASDTRTTPAEFSGFGLCHYFYQPVNFSTMTMKLDLEGMAHCKRGMPVPYGDSQCDFGDVTFCPTGMMDSTPVTAQGDFALYKARKIMGCQFPYFPSTGLSNRRNVADYIENAEAGVQKSSGVTKVCNATFRYNLQDFSVSGDATVWLVNPTFPLIGGFPSIATPTFSAPGADVRLDCINGNAWDNRVMGSRSSRVVTNIFRTAGKRSVRLDRTHTANSKRVSERVALIPVRAGDDVRISGYVRSDAIGQITEKASLSILEGSFPGIPYTKAQGQRLPGFWSRVILEVTPTVDGLLPIHLEGEGSGTYPWYATEVGLDTTGEPADPAPVLTLVDTMTFTGVTDLYDDGFDSGPAVTTGDTFAKAVSDDQGGYLSTWPSGTQSPGGGIMRGITWINWGAPGTTDDVSVEFVTTGLTDAERQGCRLVLKTAGGTILLDSNVTTPNFSEGTLDTDETYLQITLWPDAPGFELVAGTTYIAEFYMYV